MAPSLRRVMRTAALGQGAMYHSLARIIAQPVGRSLLLTAQTLMKGLGTFAGGVFDVRADRHL